MDVGRDFIFAVLDPAGSRFRREDTASLHLYDFTLSQSRFWSGRPVIVGRSLADVLDKTRGETARYCVVQSPGHFVFRRSFFRSVASVLDGAVDGHQVMAVCHLKNLHGDVFIHDQCVAVSLGRYWEARDGSSSWDMRDAAIVGGPEKPSRIVPGVGSKAKHWFVARAVGSGMAVVNFDAEARSAKHHLYPEGDGWCTAVARMNDLLANRWFTYFFNTETLPDAGGARPRALASTASGFMANAMLHSRGFDDLTTVVYYDISRPALHFKKAMWECWDGVDYPKFVRAAMSTQLVYDWGVMPPYHRDVLEDRWRSVVDWFGGQDEFKSHWARYRRLTHEWVQCDVTGDSVDQLAAALPDVPPGACSALWVGNLWMTGQTHWLRGYVGVAAAWRRNMGILARRSEVLVSGHRYDGEYLSDVPAAVLAGDTAVHGPTVVEA